jgi:hypothetical protein
MPPSTAIAVNHEQSSFMNMSFGLNFSTQRTWRIRRTAVGQKPIGARSSQALRATVRCDVHFTETCSGRRAPLNA